MPLVVYNTLYGKKEPFEPLTPGVVNMYVCGPTVYDSSHIGHARSAVVFDVVFRYLRALGFEVNYIRNFTDVDDKIIKRANELGVKTKDLAKKYIDEYHRDMDALKVLRPSREPLATEHISAIIRITRTLVEKGFAYEQDGDVYFRVESFPEYGKLSGRKLSDMNAGARVSVSEKKENPFDFALWKAAKPDEPNWGSPWGKGRPGWHIECSAMSGELLGESFDIHGGGKDLIFPHHENEIAQSEAANGKPFVRYWMHNGFVTINSEKMAKSLGNFKTVEEILRVFDPEAIRLFLLSKHYRSPIDFSEEALRDAMGGLERVYTYLSQVEARGEIPEAFEGTESEAWQRFTQAMEDDFNTAAALGMLFETVRQGNRLLQEAGEAELSRELPEAYFLIRRMGGILGLFETTGQEYFQAKRDQAAKAGALDEARVDALVAKRNEARAARDFARADAIRDQLADMGVVLEDRPDGTLWKLAE